MWIFKTQTRNQGTTDDRAFFFFFDNIKCFMEQAVKKTFLVSNINNKFTEAEKSLKFLKNPTPSGMALCLYCLPVLLF